MLPLEQPIKEHAHSLGFELAGIAPATEADGFAHLQDWLAHHINGSDQKYSAHLRAKKTP